MRYSFRLSELLGHTPDAKRRPGTIKAIVDHTGLDRHQISALLNNEVKYIPLLALSRLSDYLVEHGFASADQLPGALFAVEPENFWELLARRQRFELCLGVRSAEKSNWHEGAWVMAADSVLLGELLNGVSTLGGTAKYLKRTTAKDGDAGEPHGSVDAPPQPEHLKQTLVWAPEHSPKDEVEPLARQAYLDFVQSGNDKALVCIGSAKSNPVTELVFSKAFGATPFESEDGLAAAAERTCPIFLRYRANDPQPPSCVGGVQLSAAESADAPGIYYETKDGDWACAGWDENRHDAAMVFYVHRESQGRLEMALGGFSARATRLLARTLATRSEEFWPPVYNSRGVQLGAFIVQYTLKPRDQQPRNALVTAEVAAPKVIPLATEAIARRLET